MWAPIIAMTALSAAKTVDENMRAAAERKRQAAMTRYSPWTGMQGQTVQDANMFGNLAGGAAAGATLGQGMQQFEQGKQLNQATVDYLKNQGTQQGGMSKGLADASMQPIQPAQLQMGGQMGGMKQSPYTLMSNPQGSAGALGGLPRMRSSWFDMQNPY